MPSGTILLVEDDATTAATLQLYLERAGFGVEWIADGDQALAAFVRVAPIFVILDILLPGRDGLTVCRALRARSTVPILVLTAKSTERDILRGLEHGADDYLTKPFSPRELVARVATILRRALPATRLSSGGLVIDLDRHEARLDGTLLALTPGELRLLATLLRRPGRVFRREELLAASVHEGESGPRTIDAHIANLRKKLSPSGPTTPRIETVYGVGYRLTGAAALAPPGDRSDDPNEGADRA